ncbi:RNA polymerase sigma factor [Undibacterium terreum]|uniref:RNA polymerase sigma factor, sigma-70 family n=1 Tax=Undibacterium terreum TaxID=1224302 RepID=A0A916XD90_9BURK|nr:sigma-70 family RNA polymerase sigma factor [Undibacterium terreum]GGC63223.1 hypothetical protein GCM10011396_07720 [Undibacterium terreum]
METTLSPPEPMTDKDQRITETVLRERGRLGNFIRKRVADPVEAEDILQDVFYEFVEAYRLPEPIEQVGAWLFRVARNRIIDRFRKKKEQALPGSGEGADDADEQRWLDSVLPASGDEPEAAYARAVLLEELQAAIGELPEEQRDVFVGHELEGYSFQQMSEEFGVSVNTLLSRKRYAVIFLRGRLQAIYDEF